MPHACALFCYWLLERNNGSLTATVTWRLNRDCYYSRCLNRDVQIHPPCLPAYIRCPSLLLLGSPIHTKVLLFRRPLALSLCLLLLLHPIACTARTVPARAEPPEPRPAVEILLRIGRWQGFWGASSRDCFLPYDYFLYIDSERLLPLHWLRTTTSSTAGSPLRSSSCTEFIRLHRLRSIYDQYDWSKWYRNIRCRRHPTFHGVYS
jgi:hypothetical protein